MLLIEELHSSVSSYEGENPIFRNSIDVGWPGIGP